MTTEPRRIGPLDPDVTDPDLAPPGAGEQPATQLEALLGDLDQALKAEVPHEPVVLEVVKRPGVSIRYNTEITDEQMAAWRKRAADKKSPDGLNALRFASILLANQCEAVLMRGQEVHDEAGQLLTFGHRHIKQLYGLQPADRASDVVPRVLGSDPHVLVHMNEVLDRAGFGDQAVEVAGDDEGPTRGF